MTSWLVKSEPDVFSIEDLRRAKKTCWDGVRNYQARNYLREMALGDRVLFYHSNCDPSGIAGIAAVSCIAYPDPSQFQSQSEYFEPRATKEKPVWFSPELKFMTQFTDLLTLTQLRKVPALRDMVLLQRGSRLSVQPVTATQFAAILKLTKSE